MHDLDRVSMQREDEYEGEGYELEGESAPGYQGEYAGEYQGEYAGEYQGEYAGEYQGEYAGEYQGEYAGEQEGEAAGGSVLQEGEVMELAGRMLTVSSEQEMDRFLGQVVRRGVQAVGRAVSSPIGQAVVAAARPIIDAALPALSGAIGQGWGGPAPATTIDPAAARELGLELEGMSYEDREFEVAKQAVRLASTAGAIASTAPQDAPPHLVAGEALSAAHGQVAPGAPPPFDGPPPNDGPPPPPPFAVRPMRGPGGLRRPDAAGPMMEGGAHSGRWFRRGNRIVILGA